MQVLLITSASGRSHFETVWQRLDQKQVLRERSELYSNTVPGSEVGKVKRAALLLVALVLLGIVYEQICERRDRKRYPQIGRSVDIGGRKLNIYCSGKVARR